MFERKTWDNAHHTCKGFGGELFSVTNAYEQRFLENFTSIESWLGYRDKSRDGTWTWSDSSFSVFTDWDSSAKDDHGKGRDCVLLSSKEGKWKDASCSQTHEYLCKKKADGKDIWVTNVSQSLKCSLFLILFACFLIPLIKQTFIFCQFSSISVNFSHGRLNC